MPEALVFFCTGIFGFVGSGLISLSVGLLTWRQGKRNFTSAPAPIYVLIPAHNEEANLPLTLKSLRDSSTAAGKAIRVIVGADACADRTVEVALGAGVEVRMFSHRSKWNTLRDLASAVPAGHWVALVDSGTLWPLRLLNDLAPSLSNSTLIGIAPAYFPHSASRLERALWSLEAKWKGWENLAGGPISAHGATIFFRSEVLRECFSFLESRASAWLNDDVALPLAARILFPGAQFFYWRPEQESQRVSDAGLKEASAQFGRRRRMVVGNIQWITKLWPRAILLAPAAAGLALRRIARLFWAYWGFSLLYSFCLLLVQPGKALFAALLACVILSASFWLAGKRGIVEAALASVAAPFLFLFARSAGAERWN